MVSAHRSPTTAGKSSQGVSVTICIGHRGRLDESAGGWARAVSREEVMTSFEDEWERAGQISERLQVVARTEPVRVGFKSNSAAQLAAEKLKTSDPARRFRKP